MRKTLSLVLSALLAASTLPGCVLTPFDKDRRQVSEWDWEMIKFSSIQDVPQSFFGCVCAVPAWLVDAVIVNSIDSYKGAVLDTHYTNWQDQKEGEAQSFVKAKPRTWGSLLLLPLDFAWRANSPVNAGPHDGKLWKEFWNEHAEVTTTTTADAK